MSPPMVAVSGATRSGAMSRAVVVVGGGLAGIAAALACADAGCQVTLLEARGRLGGLTYSFRRGALEVDNGQHVFLRCCTAYRGLLDRLGVTGLVHLQDRLDIPVRTPGRPGTARLRRTGLPAPLHLAGALARHPHLGAAQRLRFVRAALALRRLDRSDPATDRRSFADWLSAQRQDPQTVAALWDLIGLATLNARADRASLALAAMVFQVGLLSRADAADIGWSLVPLQRLHGDAAAQALARVGVTVHNGAPVAAVRPADTWLAAAPSDASGTGGRWRVTVRGRPGGADRELTADDVVLAVPPDAVERLAPAGAVPLPAGFAARLGSSPIVNVHVVLDRPVLDGPFLAGAGSPVQWVFDRTRQSGLAAGQYLAVSVSAADDFRSQRRWPPCAPSCCPSWPRSCRGYARRRCWTSSSPGSRRPRSVPRRAAVRCAPVRPPRRRACGWPARGPTPAGRPPWKARYAAARPPRRPCSASVRPAGRPAPPRQRRAARRPWPAWHTVRRPWPGPRKGRRWSGKGTGRR